MADYSGANTSGQGGGFQGAAAQGGAGIGGMIGLALTSSPKDPFGSTARTNSYLSNTFVPIHGGGLSWNNQGLFGDKTGFWLTADGDRANVVNSLSGAYATGANQVGGLLSQVAPGYGALTNAAIQSIQNARSKGLSDIQSELERRNLLGSSFGMDTMARAENMYGQSEYSARAQSFVAELDASSRLIDQQTQYTAQQYNTKLNDLNLQADIAFKLGGQMNSAIQQAATASGQMAYEEAQARNAGWVSGASNAMAGLMGTGGAVGDFYTGGMAK